MGISIKAEIIRQGFKMGYVAEAIGMNTVTFSRKAQSNRFTLPETEKILSEIGLKIQIVKDENFLHKYG